MVLGIATLLVVGLGRLLTAGSDGASDPDQAAQVAARPDPGPSGEASQDRPRAKHKKKGKGKKQDQPTETAPPTPLLAQPTGPCTNDDIVATPVVAQAIGGGKVLISVELRTQVSEACTWVVSPDSLTLKITSGEDDIWSSRHCPASVPTRSLIVRQDVSTRVGVRWSGRRSDESCSALTAWALPGWYHVVAAALAGEPTDVQFELVTPPTPTVTRTVKPKTR